MFFCVMVWISSKNFHKIFSDNLHCTHHRIHFWNYLEEVCHGRAGENNWSHYTNYSNCTRKIPSTTLKISNIKNQMTNQCSKPKAMHLLLFGVIDDWGKYQSEFMRFSPQLTCLVRFVRIRLRNHPCPMHCLLWLLLADAYLVLKIPFWFSAIRLHVICTNTRTRSNHLAYERPIDGSVTQRATKHDDSLT